MSRCVTCTALIERALRALLMLARQMKEQKEDPGWKNGSPVRNLEMRRIREGIATLAEEIVERISRGTTEELCLGGTWSDISLCKGSIKMCVDGPADYWSRFIAAANKMLGEMGLQEPR